jgi:hypothetical protein
MTVLEFEVCIEHLQAGYFLAYAVGETDGGSSSKEVSDDSRNKLEKEGTTQNVERMECYGTMGWQGKRGDFCCTYLTQ